MAVLGLLSIHALLLVCWLWLIALGRSRLHYSHVLFAACLPFVGEACLLVCELIRLPQQPPYASPFSPHRQGSAPDLWQAPEDWAAQLQGSEEAARALVLQVTRRQPPNRVEIYQAGLTSPSSEVCHLCAAALQREHSLHEAAIAKAEAAYAQLPDQRAAAEALHRAISDYLASGLLDSHSAAVFRRRADALQLSALSEESR